MISGECAIERSCSLSGRVSSENIDEKSGERATLFGSTL